MTPRSQSALRLRPVLAALFLLLCPARSFSQEQSLEELLAKAAAQAARFATRFSEVKCTEQVSQEKLTASGKTEYREASTFDYLVILTSSGGDLALNESRLPQQTPHQGKNLPMLVTNGFGTLLLIFHPYYQRGFEFTALEDEVVAGKRLRRVHFQHLRGLRSPAALLLRGREYPLELAGTAWIDPDSGSVVKISARMDAGLEELGVRLLRCEVQYAPVSFSDSHDPAWFPLLATVEVETQRQHWVNTHHFTGYQLFAVNTKQSVTLPK